MYLLVSSDYAVEIAAHSPHFFVCECFSFGHIAIKNAISKLNCVNVFAHTSSLNLSAETFPGEIDNGRRSHSQAVNNPVTQRFRQLVEIEIGQHAYRFFIR